MTDRRKTMREARTRRGERLGEIVGDHLQVIDRALAAVIAAGTPADDLWVTAEPLDGREGLAVVVSSAPGRAVDAAVTVHAEIEITHAGGELRLRYTGPTIDLADLGATARRTYPPHPPPDK
jgi:hypothetical protein